MIWLFLKTELIGREALILLPPNKSTLFLNQHLELVRWVPAPLSYSRNILPLCSFLSRSSFLILGWTVFISITKKWNPSLTSSPILATQYFSVLRIGKFLWKATNTCCLSFMISDFPFSLDSSSPLYLLLHWNCSYQSPTNTFLISRHLA